MLQRRLLKSWCFSFVLGWVLLIAFLSIVDDVLFFHSDPRSLLVFVSALAAVAATAALPLLLLAGRFTRNPDRVNAGLAIGVAAALAATLLLFFLGYLHARFGTLGFLGTHWLWLFCLSAWLVAFIATCVAVARHGGRPALLERVTTLCAVATAACVALLIVHGGARLAMKHAESPQRHVVLIVLDGWPADFLHTFNPRVRKRAVDTVFKSGRVYQAMHTNANWTHGFFGTLYWGSPEFVDRSRRLRGKSPAGPDAGLPQRNLLGELQKQDVRARWMSFHRLGAPENRGIHAYTGLRSMFLTPGLARIPRALGLDYHVVMTKSEKDSLYETPLQRAVYRVVSKYRSGDPLGRTLLPEMAAIRDGAARSFLLFHTYWEMGDVQEPQAWDKPAARTGRKKGAGNPAAEIRARDYRYPPADEWYAEERRAQTERVTNRLGAALTAFFAKARAEGLLQNTTIILTADHGRMFARGRFWYGYHPDEEVMRVPMIVFGPDAGGEDRRPRETIDITRTIIDAFGEAEPLHPRAVSLLDDAPKPFTEGITLSSNKNREWFLVLYAKRRKYQFNLHPKGDGAAIEMRLDGFEAEPVREGRAVIAKRRKELRQALRDYGLGAGQLHPLYAALLKQ